VRIYRHAAVIRGDAFLKSSAERGRDARQSGPSGSEGASHHFVTPNGLKFEKVRAPGFASGESLVRPFLAA
jgi:hypothetical protein